MRVFISYRSTDAAIADRIRDALRRKGGPDAVWMAPYDIPYGQDYTQWIPHALAECDRVVLVLSRAANQSDYVRKEIDRAVKYRKAIIPVLVETFEPRGGLEFLIAGAQRIPATEQDSAAWMDDVVAAALAPLDVEVKQKDARPNFIRIDAGRIAIAAGGLATLASGVLHGMPVEGLNPPQWLIALRNATPPPLVMLGILALLAAFWWITRAINARGRRIFVVRNSDVVAISGLLTGVALLATFFLFTPLAAAVLTTLLYLPARRVFVRRWGALAAATGVLVVVAAWWIEGGLYRFAFDRGTAVAVVPVCGDWECEWDPDRYRSLVEGVATIINDETSMMMPNQKTSVRFYDSREAFEKDNRWANVVTLLTHGHTFDRLVQVTLRRSCAPDEDSQGYLFTASAFDVPERAPPFWSDWRRGRALPLDDVLRFEGETREDARLAQLLLGGLIIKDLLGKGEGEPLASDPHRVEIARRFLAAANQGDFQDEIPEAVRAAVREGAQGASPETVSQNFSLVLDELKSAAANDAQKAVERCDRANKAAWASVQARNHLPEASEPEMPPPPEVEPSGDQTDG